MSFNEKDSAEVLRKAIQSKVGTKVSRIEVGKYYQGPPVTFIFPNPATDENGKIDATRTLIVFHQTQEVFYLPSFMNNRSGGDIFHSEFTKLGSRYEAYWSELCWDYADDIDLEKSPSQQPDNVKAFAEIQ
ncbi:MAG: hypothetical protein R3A45_05795 [Bdellovibrionota bacterium]